MKNLLDIIDRFLSPKTVLIMFAVTACVGFLKGILDIAVFGSALGTVLGYFYGSKQGEAAANLANAQVDKAADIISKDKGILFPVENTGGEK